MLRAKIFQIITGILRAVLAAYWGKLVEQGYVSSDDLSQAIGGVLVVVVTIGWSAWQKYRTHTEPGGPFNPAAPVKKATLPGRRDLGYVAWDLFGITMFVCCFWADVLWLAIQFIPELR